MRFSDLDAARIGVWGAGREIRSFAHELARRLPSAQIVAAIFDEPPPGDVRELLHAPAARIVAAGGAVEALADAEVLVRSPGVSIHRPELIALRERGLAVTTATSLWIAERAGRRVVGVTGTKGKSTTAALVHHLALAAGEQAELAGNIGVPALNLLDLPPEWLAVIELSSFQIADLARGPEVVVFTNLYREHVDWHGSEENYRTEKLRILGLDGVREAVLPARQPELATAATPASLRLFGDVRGWDCDEVAVSHAGRPRVSIAELPLPGEHNALNLCAALTALEAAGIPIPALPEALSGFTPLPHRLQVVAEQHGVTWVNDSISTTPESTLAALASFPARPLVLLAGGQDRGQDHAALARELARLDAVVIGVPTTGARLLEDARAAGLPDSHAIAAADLPEAVSIARAKARPGAVVLLSPAAPSFDHYRDFQERGDRFRTLLEVS